MISSRMTKRFLVAIADFLILSATLYLSLSLRYLSFVSWPNFLYIYYPFLIIIFSTIVIFYMYGLYDKMTVKIYNELNKRIISSLVLSSILGTVIFYTSPYFSIAPKTILLIYIALASLLIFFWRRYARVFVKSGLENKILLVAAGDELKELQEELENNKIINAKKVVSIDLSIYRDLDLYTKIKNKIQEEGFNMLGINMHHQYVKNDISLFYELFLENVSIINFADLYEEVLGKIPLDNIDAGWFFNNLYDKQNKFYEKSKRVLDLILAVPAFLVSLIFYPIVFIFLKIQDGGSLFFVAERIGKDNKLVYIYKFRSMTDLKNENIDVSSKMESERITKFGEFIRKTRIDELPQLINVLKGEVSLIGPRPELPKLVTEYSNQIPFYGVRHMITPGLSGYAQIYQDPKSVPKFGLETDKTKQKLSYDVYYLKHRSLILDISLIIKTIKTLIGKTGL